ncbi:2-oxo-4-hydroxy-4-carboxy-5-ureidoimidazoline decarboxylase [Amycolatopsis arida]|uniref:2-oxo-4-hydroxy-4-carboxy-5-ureidoimidazoline decarboxylase n=1 Tax=Amycolatopsis arida TaxID=587909 RepID=A0A1I5KG60_9PSEU|nr:2-oxo-4-hydroxy-4-carboxy-5-ureidoimidazoline decarboxylase [Amycolatopsis arida]TDX97029.1 2-oxo-4-hydroxy-4-carboxy-5-ureidoimidazoline decarboxylase [Amycolatopsis arida]SFO83977.1 2-oxo-4-hydroxy-4-carboxy-5-ureidoimidazoline decarboxylase [Amycolatopsis arida]
MSPPTSNAQAELSLAEFNSAATDRVRGLLTECLAVPRWVDTVLAGRPYPDLDALLAAAEAAGPLRPAEVRGALDSHPRIGERVTGGWSRTEQSGVDDAAAESFRAANAEYERRFGHIYLVCASGRDGAELLADLRRRLANDPDAELAVAGRELMRIASLRLRKAVRP